MQKSAGTIIFLEYFRVYAFMAVFISHKFPQWAHIQLNDANYVEHLVSIIYNALMPTLTNGQAGVVIFFFISGYIIANKVDQEPTLVFLVKRIFRIYPLYISCLLGQDLLQAHHLPPLSVLLAQFTLMGDFFGTPTGLGVEWTLRIEMTFYLFAALLTLFPAFKHRIPVFVLILNLAAIISIVMPPFPSWSPDTFGHFNQFFPLLMTGMGLYYFDTGKTPFWSILLIITIGISALAATNMVILMFFSFFAVMIYRAKIPQWLWVRHISCLTYGFYLIHLWLYDILQGAYLQHGFVLWQAEALSFLSLIAICYAAHFIIEKPGIQLGHLVTKVLSRHKRAVPVMLPVS
jgi:peptidoglycan/LPS O-acetylase OafA/YrhL